MCGFLAKKKSPRLDDGFERTKGAGAGLGAMVKPILDPSKRATKIDKIASQS